eukprot:Polyplicarium_translucidae@DN4326_c0_g1_i1.p1
MRKSWIFVPWAALSQRIRNGVQTPSFTEQRADRATHLRRRTALGGGKFAADGRLSKFRAIYQSTGTFPELERGAGLNDIPTPRPLASRCQGVSTSSEVLTSLPGAQRTLINSADKETERTSRRATTEHRAA